MDTQIKAIHFDITEKLTAFINKKTEKLAHRYPSITAIEVSLKVVKPETSLNKRALIVVNVPTRDDVVAEKVADTFEEAIDLSLEAIERQLEKLKGAK
jgi:site-specific recombinase